MPSMSLDEFVATRKWEDHIDDDTFPMGPGFVYAQGLYINKTPDGWHLILDRSEYETTDLPVLEKLLYEYFVQQLDF